MTKVKNIKLINTWIEKYEELEFDGYAVVCHVCNIRLVHLQKDSIERHVRSGKHRRRKYESASKGQFFYEIKEVMTAMGIQWRKIDRPVMRQFFQKLCPYQNIPMKSPLQNHHLQQIYFSILNHFCSIFISVRFWIISAIALVIYFSLFLN